MWVAVCKPATHHPHPHPVMITVPSLQISTPIRLTMRSVDLVRCWGGLCSHGHEDGAEISLELDRTYLR